MRRALPFALLALAACGEAAPHPQVSLSLAPDYTGVVVARISSDGIGVDGLEAFDIELSGLQSAGGQVVGTVRRRDRGPSYEAQGTFDADTGQFRFDAFEATLTSTRTERVDALGGRADDETGDGVGDVLTGYVRTSSAARFETDGDLVAVEVTEGMPTLDPSKLSAVEVELGKVIVRADPGFTQGGVGVEILIFSPFEPEPRFRLSQSPSSGALLDVAVDGVSGDIVVVRPVRSGRRGAPTWRRVVDAS